MQLSDSQKSGLLFILLCIPIRSALAYLAYTNKFSLLPYITAIIGIGFLYIYFTGSRKTGAETFGKPIWWNNLRLFHGILFIAFSVLYLMKCEKAWMVLAADVAIGLGGFIIQRVK